MNCRKVNSLLSAYMDGELSRDEMRGVNTHLENCSSCRNELNSLQETKRLVASLAFRAPRAELEGLLLAEAERNGSFRLSLIAWLEDVRDRALVNGGVLRPRPMAATLLLSMAGLWMASASLDRRSDPGFPSGMGNLSVMLMPESASAASTVQTVPMISAATIDASPYATASYNYNGNSERAFIRTPRRVEENEAAYVPASMDVSRSIPGMAILFSLRHSLTARSAH